MDVLHSLFGGWYAEPVPLVAAAAAVLVYDRGARRLAADPPGRAPSRAQQAWLVAGVVVILVALLSPLDDLALRLQWAHMVQHVLLLVVAPPLIVLARPWDTGVAAASDRACAALLRAPLAGHSPRQRRRALASAARGASPSSASCGCGTSPRSTT